MAAERYPSWNEQFARHFAPYAAQSHAGYTITVSCPCPEAQATLCIRIGEPRVGSHDSCVQAELHSFAQRALAIKPPRPRVQSAVEFRPWGWSAIAAGVCAGLGVFFLSHHSVGAAVVAGCIANLAAAGAETWRRWQDMKAARSKAMDITRQFRAQGDPPVPAELYLPDPGRRTATLFVRLIES